MSGQIEQSQLSSLLRRLLEERSLSLRKLSEMTYIDAATLSRILNGKRRANADHLLRIAECLDVSLAQLFKAAGYTIDEGGPSSDIHSSIDIIESVLQTADTPKQSFAIHQVKQMLETCRQYSLIDEGAERIQQEFEKKIKKVGGIGPFIDHMKGMFERFRLGEGTSSELISIGGVLLYFIISVDVIPDYTFPIGYIDDAIAVKLTLHSLSTKA